MTSSASLRALGQITLAQDSRTRANLKCDPSRPQETPWGHRRVSWALQSWDMQRQDRPSTALDAAGKIYSSECERFPPSLSVPLNEQQQKNMTLLPKVGPEVSQSQFPVRPRYHPQECFVCVCVCV